MFNPYSIILALFALSGVVIAVQGWRVLQRAKNVKSWPTASGVIVASQMPASEFDSPTPMVTFRYEINGRYYERSQDFHGQSLSWEFCKKFTEKYPIDASVQIFYDVRNPGNATLEPGLEKGDWMLFATGVLVTVSGVIFLAAGL